MANFQTLVNLIVEHNFFADGLCKDLTFIPTPTTAKRLEQEQLIVRTKGYGLTLYGDNAGDGDKEDENENQKLSVTKNEELILRFLVFTKDPHFGSYTHEMINKDTPLFFTTTNSANGVLPATPFYTPESLSDDAMDTRRVVQPIFTVDIDVSRKKQMADEKYAIKLNARDIYWKYYFFGDLANLDLEIHDLNAQAPISFRFCNEPVAKNGKAFISQSAIMLNEVPKEKFQLKDKNNSGKVLIKRLPNAGTQLIGKERDSNGQPILVAEIYINQ